jgi:hypothetical protein
MADTWVLLRHPGTGGRCAVSERGAEALYGLGWERIGGESYPDQPTAARALAQPPDDEPEPAPEPPAAQPTKPQQRGKKTAGEPAEAKE